MKKSTIILIIVAIAAIVAFFVGYHQIPNIKSETSAELCIFIEVMLLAIAVVSTCNVLEDIIDGKGNK